MASKSGGIGMFEIALIAVGGYFLYHSLAGATPAAGGGGVALRPAPKTGQEFLSVLPEYSRLTQTDFDFWDNQLKILGFAGARAKFVAQRGVDYWTQFQA